MIILGQVDPSDFSEEERIYSVASKALWAMAPGAYQAKEAGKYAYGSDTDEYKAKRAGLALKGAFTPITASAINQKAKRMAKEGRSKQEIKDFIEGRGKYEHLKRGRVAGGIGEVLTASAGGLGHAGASVLGLIDKVSGERASDIEREKKGKHK